MIFLPGWLKPLLGGAKNSSKQKTTSIYGSENRETWGKKIVLLCKVSLTFEGPQNLFVTVSNGILHQQTIFHQGKNSFDDITSHISVFYVLSVLVSLV